MYKEIYLFPPIKVFTDDNNNQFISDRVGSLFKVNTDGHVTPCASKMSTNAILDEPIFITAPIKILPSKNYNCVIHDDS